MKILKFGLIITVFALFIFACSQNSTTVNNLNSPTNTTVNSNIPSLNAGNTINNQSGTNDLASAQKIYSEKCIKCHKEDGTGGVTDIEGTKIKAPNLTSDRQKGKPDSDYIEVVENGAKEDGMPAFKNKISDADIKNLVTYIRHNFQGK